MLSGGPNRGPRQNDRPAIDWLDGRWDRQHFRELRRRANRLEWFWLPLDQLRRLDSQVPIPIPPLPKESGQIRIAILVSWPTPNFYSNTAMRGGADRT